ncbi:Inositol hexakisphosphate and diphosphoinositol-pentakisphosphate kinase 2 [Mactra antiquata]
MSNLVGSRSSVYSTISRVRKTGSYIYEDFMPTDGTDVKVYTVGPDYVHAEARKSPALDGKVERDKDGKEVRYPVILSATEKMIARKICLAFKQNVCGFDLLRTGGKSYVCDVNGFSFVKNSTKYYDDCANVLGTMIVRALAPQLHIQNVALVLGAAPEDIPVVPTTSGSMMELRCVIAVIRHGDRTPKQKMKMEVKHKKFFELFEKHNGYKKGHLKLKKPKQLQEVLDIARDLLNESGHDPNPEILEKKAKLRQLKLVLEMYGHFSGINRKVQLKYQPYGAPKKSSSEEGLNFESTKYDVSPHEYPKEPSLVLILKWGGELTPAGKYQAEDLGKAFRTLYPGGQGEFETPGLGFLRLHSTYRHDLKIYASDEGRVQMTAAAFTKGLLALEGELTPILVSMVKSANTNGLLDKEGETSKYQHVVKERLMEILNQDSEFTEEDIERLAPTMNKSLLKAIEFIKNPKRMCDSVYEMVQEIVAKIRSLKLELKSRDLKLYHGESWELLIRRWAKLEKDFKLKSGNYDISKIPDIYDCIKYDLQHNQKTLQFSRAEELFLFSKALADIVIPQEYGITIEEKLHISQSICTPLMRKIHSDLHQGCQGTDEESTRLNSKYSKGVASPERFVRTRLYFTSESHIHSLLNMLRYGGLCEETKDEQWKKAMEFLSTTPELNYMTQINIMMFEDPSKEPGSPEKFHVELLFSPGAYTSSDKTVVNPASSGYRTSFLVRQSKTSHEVKHKDIDKSRTEDSGITDVIKDTITEESFVDESNTPENDDKPVTDKTCQKCSVGDEFVCADDLVIPNDAVGADDAVISNDAVSADEAVITNDAVSADDAVSAAKKMDHKVSDTQKDMEIEIDKDNSTEIVTGAMDIDIDKNDVPEVVIEARSESLDPDEGTMSGTSAREVKVRTVVQSEDKDLVAIENDARMTNDDDDTNVDELLHSKVPDDKEEIESVGLQCDISETESTNKETIPEVKVEQHGATESKSKTESTEKQLSIKKPKKFDVVITKPDESYSKVAERPKVLGKSQNMESSDSDNVLFAETFEDEHSKTITNESELLVQSSRSIPGPKSPDPDIPEWDWDDTFTEKKAMGSDTTLKVISSEEYEADKSHLTVSSKSESSISKPILIHVSNPTKMRDRAGSFDEGRKSFDEKRSRSLEDSENRDVFSILEKHYCTIHLPIKDSHHSFSSLLYLNPEAFKAFDGFNMVPSLKPLETLHNNLTMQDLDMFLSRTTTSKFFTPVSSPMYGQTPLASPRCPDLVRSKASSGPSLPSSSNSSAGPSSPTSSTPIDFMNSGNFYVINRLKSEPTVSTIDQSEMDSSKSLSANQKSDNSHVTSNKPMRLGASSAKQSDSIQSSPELSATQSAFKTVNRSNSQNKQSMFVVSQVKEESLPVKKSVDSVDEVKTSPNVEKDIVDKDIADGNVKSSTEDSQSESQKS